jgi:ubiquinone biosynthesis protein
MDLIKTGLGLSRTIRNAARLKEIATVFAKHGFQEFVSKQVTIFFPDFVLPKSSRDIKHELKDNPNKDWGQIVGSRLKLCFEELGPSFVKIGQLISSREDLFEESFLAELRSLRDDVKGIPFDQVIGEIENAYGDKFEKYFSYIDPNALGTASIGLVYAAKTLSGDDVVIKVRRPGIKKIIENDFSILIFLVNQLEKVSEEIKKMGIQRVLEDFSFSLQSELNFHMEALNAKRIKENYSRHDLNKIYYFPKVYSELTRENILVLERIKGVSFNSTELKGKVDKALTDKLLAGVEIFVKSFLKDGFYHADLHAGNFFLQEDGNIAIIDFGLMGTLSLKSRQSFLALIYAIVTHNYENLVYEFLDVAHYEKLPNIEELVSDVKTALSPFVGLTVNQVNFSDILQIIMKTLYKHQVYLPNDWYMVFRALITLDGVGKSLGLDVDLYGLLEKDIEGLIKGAVSKDELLEEAAWAGKDLLTSLRILPRHLKWYVREWAKRNYAFEVFHKGHEKSFQDLSTAIRFLGMMVLTSILLLAATSIIPKEVVYQYREWPTASYVLYALGAFLMMQAWRSIKK